MAPGADDAGRSGGGQVDEGVRAYIDGIAPGSRALFDRIQALILAAYPQATVALSYKMPSYRVGGRRLYVGAWKHGVSVYGWKQGREADFTARHPQLRTSKGTIQLRSRDAAAVTDDEILGLIRAALEPDDQDRPRS
jgi:uncharacterized protein YdhG (YjbR/CyaY superfamily)